MSTSHLKSNLATPLSDAATQIGSTVQPGQIEHVPTDNRQDHNQQTERLRSAAALLVKGAMRAAAQRTVFNSPPAVAQNKAMSDIGT